MYLLLFYKLLLFLLLSLIDILNKLYLLPNYLHNYLSLYILSKIGPAFIKISQVSQNNSIDRSNFETINEYLNILDNIYSSKIINTVDLNTEQNIDIIKTSLNILSMGLCKDSPAVFNISATMPEESAHLLFFMWPNASTNSSKVNGSTVMFVDGLPLPSTDARVLA